MSLIICFHGVEISPSKEEVIAGGIPNSIIRLIKLLSFNVYSIIITNDRKYRETGIITTNFFLPFTEIHMILIKGKYASIKYFLEYFFKVIVKIEHLNKKNKISIIHGHSGHPALAIVTNFASLITRIPSVHTIYCPINPKNKTNCIYNYFFKNINMIIAISENIKASLISVGIPQEKIKVIPPVIDFSKFYWNEKRSLIRKELSLNETDFVILYLGNLTETKGIELILDSLKILKSRDIDFKLISGIELTHTSTDKRRKQIIDKINNYNIKDNIIELGLIKNVPDVMNASDIIVAPFEHTYDVADYPLTILEAMAVGIPVITTAVGGIPEIISDQDTGIIIDYKNSNNLADHIVNLIKYPELRFNISKNAKLFVKKKFSETDIVDMVYQVYRGIHNE